MKLLDHNIIENRPTTKGNSYFIRKNNNTPVEAISVNRIPQINECELVSNADQQFIDIPLKSQNTPVIRSTHNMLSHTEDSPSRYNNSKNQFNLKLIILWFLNSKIMLIKSDEAAMKYFKKNILSDIKKQFSDVAKRLVNY